MWWDGDVESEVRDAGEDLQSETAGAIELTVDYSSHKDSCDTYVHTLLERPVCRKKDVPLHQTAHPQ